MIDHKINYDLLTFDRAFHSVVLRKGADIISSKVPSAIPPFGDFHSLSLPIPKSG